MKRFLKKIALLVLIAGLPMQNLHAVAMPLCGQDKETTAAHHQSAQDGDMAGHDHDNRQHAASDVNAPCDGCSMCDACSAPAIASVAFDVSLDSVETPPAVLASHISLFDPEQLQRPPRQFLA